MENIEIERKYLTKNIPFDITKYPYKSITQIYISTNPTIRIRKYDNKYVLTVKSSGEMIRQEFELEITEQQFINLSKKAETPELSKRRYYYPLENGLTAEIDIYEGICKSLITTEVEFETEEEAKNFSAPEWFGEEITLDNRYKNTNLAKHGIPK